MNIPETKWPRVRDLPNEEQEPFMAWLAGQTCPWIKGVESKDQDAYYTHDYQQWKAGLPALD